MEKREGFRVESRSLLADFNENLSLQLQSLRLIKVYDLFGFTPELLEKCDKLITGFDPHEDELKDIVKVYDVSGMDLRLCNDMKKERILCFIGEEK